MTLMLLTTQKALCICHMSSTSRSYSVLYVSRADDLLTTAVWADKEQNTDGSIVS